MTTFSVGDIVMVDGNTHTEGQVVSVEVDGYVGVRMPTNGTVFSFWPDELAATGKRIDPAKLAAVTALTTAMEMAEQSAYKLRQFRNAYVQESIVEVEA